MIDTTTAIAGRIRSALKAEMPQCRFSVTTKYFSMGSSITVALMQAPVLVFVGPNDVNGNPIGKAYAQLNEYQLKPDAERHISNGYPITVEAWGILCQMYAIAKREHQRDTSDPYADYGPSQNFYLHLEVGHWDKPYQCIQRRQPMDRPPATDGPAAGI